MKVFFCWVFFFSVVFCCKASPAIKKKKKKEKFLRQKKQHQLKVTYLIMHYIWQWRKRCSASFRWSVSYLRVLWRNIQVPRTAQLARKLQWPAHIDALSTFFIGLIEDASAHYKYQTCCEAAGFPLPGFLRKMTAANEGQVTQCFDKILFKDQIKTSMKILNQSKHDTV